MASASGFGRTGPQRDLVAYGTLLQCFTGWAALSAYPGRRRRSSGGTWTDPLTACMEAFLLLSAIWRQRRPGEGCFYDLSMSETMIAALPEPILAWSWRRRAGGARQPRSARGAAGLLPGRRRRPLARAERAATTRRGRRCASDRARRPARTTLRLATAAGRRARHDELDAAIAAWTGHAMPPRRPRRSRRPASPRRRR